jgi:hypothetical protein
MVDFFRQPLIMGVPILTIRDYVGYTTQIENMHPDVSGFFLGLTDEIIEEMDPEASKLAIYQLKLDYESTMRNNAGYPKGYEQARFKARNMQDAVVVEARCEKCRYYVPSVINYIQYTKLAKEAVPYPITLTKINCPHCKMPDSHYSIICLVIRSIFSASSCLVLPPLISVLDLTMLPVRLPLVGHYVFDFVALEYPLWLERPRLSILEYDSQDNSTAVRS